MEIFELLKSAIAQKKKITYEYEMPKKAVGLRTGNPHIIFTSKAGDTNIAIYKTGGLYLMILTVNNARIFIYCYYEVCIKSIYNSFMFRLFLNI